MSRFLILLSLLTPVIAVFGFQRPVYANTLPEVVCLAKAPTDMIATVARIGWRTTDGAEHVSPRWGLPMPAGGHTCVELLTKDHQIATHHTFTALATKYVANIWIESKVWGARENTSQRCPIFDIQNPPPPTDNWFHAEHDLGTGQRTYAGIIMCYGPHTKPTKFGWLKDYLNL